jgi:peptidoglycan/xylan/chitin deacetylase (PgdA/CDA1 family)
MLKQFDSRMKIPILAYHQVMPWENNYPPAKSGLVVPETRFRQQILLLRYLGFQSITLSQLLEEKVGQKRKIAITFDDGYAGIHEYALPILLKYGYQATFYPIAEDFIREPSVGRAFPVLKDEQVRLLLRSGWELGSHSVSHPHLTSLSSEDLEREVSESRQILQQRFGMEVRTFSYPYGDFTTHIRQVVQKAGFCTAVGVEPLPGLSTDFFSLPRITVGYQQSLMMFLWRLWRFYLR